VKGTKLVHLMTNLSRSVSPSDKKGSYDSGGILENNVPGIRGGMKTIFAAPVQSSSDSNDSHEVLDDFQNGTMYVRYSERPSRPANRKDDENDD